MKLADQVIQSIDSTKLLGSLAESKVDKKDGTPEAVNHHKRLVISQFSQYFKSHFTKWKVD